MGVIQAEVEKVKTINTLVIKGKEEIAQIVSLIKTKAERACNTTIQTHDSGEEDLEGAILFKRTTPCWHQNKWV